LELLVIVSYAGLRLANTVNPINELPNSHTAAGNGTGVTSTAVRLIVAVLPGYTIFQVLADVSVQLSAPADQLVPLSAEKANMKDPALMSSALVALEASSKCQLPSPLSLVLMVADPEGVFSVRGDRNPPRSVSSNIAKSTPSSIPNSSSVIVCIELLVGDHIGTPAAFAFPAAKRARVKKADLIDCKVGFIIYSSGLFSYFTTCHIAILYDLSCPHHSPI